MLRFLFGPDEKRQEEPNLLVLSLPSQPLACVAKANKVGVTFFSVSVATLRPWRGGWEILPPPHSSLWFVIVAAVSDISQVITYS